MFFALFTFIEGELVEWYCLGDPNWAFESTIIDGTSPFALRQKNGSLEGTLSEDGSDEKAIADEKLVRADQRIRAVAEPPDGPESQLEGTIM